MLSFFSNIAQISSGLQDCPFGAVGVADSNIIPNSSLTASSELRAEYGANKARFTSDRAWEPDGTDANPNDYLQIHLGKVYSICAVATKGNEHSGLDEWTTEYNISTSVDGTTWIWYPDNNNIQVVNNYNIIVLKKKTIGNVKYYYRLHVVSGSS